MRYTPRQIQVHLDTACLLGYVCREQGRLLDPDAPAGITVLPTDPSLVSILHQFTIALLCLDRDCPPTWTCPCNALRRRYNRPPADHETPTDALALGELRRALDRQRQWFRHPGHAPDEWSAC